MAALVLISVLPILVPAADVQRSPEPALRQGEVPSALGANDMPLRVYLHPGVSDSYKQGWSHTLDTLWGTQGAGFVTPVPNMPPGTPETNPQTRQLFDHYLDYAILASSSDSIGDFQLDITVLPPTGINYVQIYVPPDFKWNPDISRDEAVWTDITNDYQYIWTRTLSDYDPIAPNWVRITIGMDERSGGLMLIQPGTYHMRLFNLRAPDVAGLYHFKIYYSAGYTYVPVSIGAGNYPIMVVKSELNPAWVEVTVRTDAFHAVPYVSGRVIASGTTPEGGAVKGIGYWGPIDYIGDSPVPGQVGAEYRLYLFGLAAGTYTLTAEASGFSPTTTAQFTFDPGQSYKEYITVFNSPPLHVTISSKDGAGPIPWHNLWQLPYGTNNPAVPPNNAWPRRDMTINLFDSTGNLITWWASNVLAPFGATKYIPSTNTLAGLHDDSGCIPTANQYNAQLTDNSDLLGNPRGALTHNPSTQWDGHVPWDTADYVAGMPNGGYTVEAYVTGYIMDDADAHQRTFTLSGSAINLQFDLRRSNWIETTMHLPANILLSGPTTVSLFAYDKDGNERGATTFLATHAMSLDGVLNGVDASAVNGYAPGYAGGIVIEGWNAVFPHIGSYKGGVSMANDPIHKDYGLNPTPSTTRLDKVPLGGNPYTIRLHMADMGLPYAAVAGTGWYNPVGGDPQTSVFLGNSPVPLSFSVVNASLWISLRSVDFQVPAHNMPWTFPSSEIDVGFFDTTGAQVDTLDATLYGLFQDPGRTTAGFVIPGAAAGSFGVTPFDIDSVNIPGQHGHVGLAYYGSDFTSPTVGYGLPIYRALLDFRPTRLPPGEYAYAAYTHGYIMRPSSPVQIPLSGKGNIEANLIQGAQIRVMMEFRNQGVLTPFNGFVRVEVFNSEGKLVGASVYGQAQPNSFTLAGTPNGAYLPYAGSADWMNVRGPAQGTDFGPNTAVFPSSTLGVSNGQRAWYSWLFYHTPSITWGTPVAGVFPTSTGWLYPSPSDANRILYAGLNGDVLNFDVYGFYWHHGGPARTWGGGWPTVNMFPGASAYRGIQWDSGLRGSSDVAGWAGSGGGKYTVKVWAFDPRGPNNAYELVAPSDDWRMYSMGSELKDIEAPWGGALQLFITMNNMASLRGTVRWFDMFGNLRPLPWARIQTTDPAHTSSSEGYPAYALGVGATGSESDPWGAYVMWLPPGSHNISVDTSEAPQIWSASAPTQNAEFSVAVSNGWVGGGASTLAPSGYSISRTTTVSTATQTQTSSASTATATGTTTLSAIHGTIYVYDTYGNLLPLGWAQVLAVSQDRVSIVTSSNIDGTYAMYVASGTYNVTASKEGFISQSHIGTVSSGGALVADFQLTCSTCSVTTTVSLSTTTASTTGTQTTGGLQMQVVSNSTVSGLIFDSTRGILNFTVSGPTGSYGFFDATIAKTLLIGHPIVLIDGIEHPASVTEDVSFWYVHITYPHSEHHVTIGGSGAIPEFPSFLLLTAVFVLVMAVLRVRRADHQRRSRFRPQTS